MGSLLESMEELPRSMQRTIGARALRKGSEPVRQRAEELAPIDETQTDHPLKEGMMISIVEQAADHWIAKIGPSREGFYGQFQEFGTVDHAAQPFLIPAFEERKAEAVGIIGSELASGIEKAFKKIG